MSCDYDVHCLAHEVSLGLCSCRVKERPALLIRMMPELAALGDALAAANERQDKEDPRGFTGGILSVMMEFQRGFDVEFFRMHRACKLDVINEYGQFGSRGFT